MERLILNSILIFLIVTLIGIEVSWHRAHETTLEALYRSCQTLQERYEAQERLQVSSSLSGMESPSSGRLSPEES